MYAPYKRTILRFLSKIKVIHYSLKRSYQTITQSINVEHQLIEHFDKKNVLGCVKCFGVRFTQVG